MNNKTPKKSVVSSEDDEAYIPSDLPVANVKFTAVAAVVPGVIKSAVTKTPAAQSEESIPPKQTIAQLRGSPSMTGKDLNQPTGTSMESNIARSRQNSSTGMLQSQNRKPSMAAVHPPPTTDMDLDAIGKELDDMVATNFSDLALDTTAGPGGSPGSSSVNQQKKTQTGKSIKEEESIKNMLNSLRISTVSSNSDNSLSAQAGSPGKTPQSAFSVLTTSTGTQSVASTIDRRPTGGQTSVLDKFARKPSFTTDMPSAFVGVRRSSALQSPGSPAKESSSPKPGDGDNEAIIQPIAEISDQVQVTPVPPTPTAVEGYIEIKSTETEYPNDQRYHKLRSALMEYLQDEINYPLVLPFGMTTLDQLQ